MKLKEHYVCFRKKNWEGVIEKLKLISLISQHPYSDITHGKVLDEL